LNLGGAIFGGTIFGGAALQRCGARTVLNAALASAEKLDLVLAFGWRSGSRLR
jgi:hypothetical protein